MFKRMQLLTVKFQTSRAQGKSIETKNAPNRQPLTVALAFGCLLLFITMAMLTPPKSVQANPTALFDNQTAHLHPNDVLAAARNQLAAADTLTPTLWTPPGTAYRIEVTADGLYTMDYAYLAAAGLPVDTIDPRTFRMFFLGREIPIAVAGESDGRFEPGDVIRFYGRNVDSLYYDGLLPTHKYTGATIFWLSYGTPANGDIRGQRMARKDGSLSGSTAGPSLETIRLEQQTRYESRYPRYRSGARFRPEDDHWLWYKLQVFSAPKQQRLTVSLPQVATDTRMGEIKVKMVGGLTGRHGLRLFVNNVQVFEDSTTWRDYEPFTAVAPVTQTLFTEGDNLITIEAFNVDVSISELFIDWVEVSYYRDRKATGAQFIFHGEAGDPTAQGSGVWQYTVDNFASANIFVYDVTNLEDVQQVSDIRTSGSGPYSVVFGDRDYSRRYLATTPDVRVTPASISLHEPIISTFTPSQPWVQANGNSGRSDLLSKQNGADWIVITHKDFWDATMTLSDYRQSKYRVAQVDVQQIYDQFNGGMMSSEAIRDFLAYAHTNWQPPAPQYVLLSGGGTSDMRGYFSNSKKTYVPTFIYPVDPILGETATDNRLVTFLGNDILPDMDVGRFPAFTAEEVAVMVRKSIHYESTPTINDWNTNILLISDDLEGGGGDFYHFSDVLASGYADANDPQGTKFMPAPYSASKAYLGRTCDLGNPGFATECRGVISDTIHSGALLVSYVGHAQTKNWAVEKMMDLNLANSLTNYDRLSIFLGMACFEGFFHQPPSGSRSLGETYVLNPNGGAVASWSPTGFGVATGHDWMEQGLFLALFQDRVGQLGSAMTQGKEYLYHNAPAHKYDDLIDTFVLFWRSRVAGASICGSYRGGRQRTHCYPAG